MKLTNRRPPATDLGWLLHKHPDKVQAFPLAFGSAHVFYPETFEERCTAALLLDIDPVGLVRRRGGPSGERFALEQYVNDRPYVASSFMSVAIAQVFGTALGGRCAQRPELVDAVLPLEAQLAALPCRGGEALLADLFGPLGYEVEATRHPRDPQFPEWGESPYHTVTLRGSQRLQDLLAHLYVLIPVLDNDKHYWVGEAELEKLLRHGEGWLANHPAREEISWRYLKRRRGLARAALARLAEEEDVAEDRGEQPAADTEEALETTIGVSIAELGDTAANPHEPGGAGDLEPSPKEDDGATALTPEDEGEKAADGDRRPSLHTLRLATVLAVLRGSGATTVVDLGCGEGRLLMMLMREKQLTRIVGVDASMRSLQFAADRMRLERMAPRQRARITLLHGALTYRDERLAGLDAAACVEVIEHLDPPRLEAFARAVFEFARPATIVLTTPNREYNVRFPTLPAGKFRHRDHRFEWTREEFRTWADATGERFGYAVRYLPIGPDDPEVGPPSQMAVFQRVLEG